MNLLQPYIHTTVEVSGIPLSVTSFEYVLPAMHQIIQSGYTKRYISITNTESMYHALRIGEHSHYIRNSDFSLCDGIGSVIAGLAWGHKVPRLNGPILMLKACEYGAGRGWRHFFYGGDTGVADRMVEKLSAQFPGLISAGTYCPPFRELTLQEKDDIRRLIKAARPDMDCAGY